MRCERAMIDGKPIGSTKKYALRGLLLLVGNTFYAFGIVISVNANIGYAPCEIFHMGLSLTTGISFGVVSIIVGIVLVVIVTISGEIIGFGTVISMIITGLIIDLLFMLNIIHKAENMIVGIIMLVAGLFIISLGSYFYISSALGVGPRDNLMVVMTRKTKMPVGVCRSIVELSITLVGWLLGGMVGIGTVISVIAIGFCIQITFNIFKFNPAEVEHETLKQTYKALKGAMRRKE